MIRMRLIYAAIESKESIFWTVAFRLVTEAHFLNPGGGFDIDLA